MTLYSFWGMMENILLAAGSIMIYLDCCSLMKVVGCYFGDMIFCIEEILI
jgi:hypothetical protein